MTTETVERMDAIIRHIVAGDPTWIVPDAAEGAAAVFVAVHEPTQQAVVLAWNGVKFMGSCGSDEGNVVWTASTPEVAIRKALRYAASGQSPFCTAGLFAPLYSRVVVEHTGTREVKPCATRPRAQAPAGDFTTPEGVAAAIRDPAVYGWLETTVRNALGTPEAHVVRDGGQAAYRDGHPGATPWTIAFPFDKPPIRVGFHATRAEAWIAALAAANDLKKDTP